MVCASGKRAEPPARWSAHEIVVLGRGALTLEELDQRAEHAELMVGVR
jgi:hypothetical protein